MRSTSSHLEFDLNLAKEQSEKNPVYYLQYAHARIASILRFAEEQGTFNMADISTGIDYSLLKGPTEIALTKLLLDFPETIESCAMHFEPHRLTTYLQDIAAAFHRFYHEHRIVIPELDIAKARLVLCLAAKTVLANGCAILGITAPERM
jgi:arginyl-tRNA synthetase